MSHHPGKFVFRELMTHDPAGARRFYGGLLGWSFDRMGDHDYELIGAGGEPVGGLFDLGHMGEEGKHVPAQWAGYVSVEDVDATVEKAKGLGAAVLHGPTDLDGVGRFAYLRDPQGGGLYVMRRTAGDGEDRQPRVGEFAFELLNAADPATLIPFYTGIFGWTASPMGPTTALARAGGAFVAAVAPAMPGSPAHWLTHIVVADLDATNARATELGGTVLEPRIDVPGYGGFALIKDPEGCLFMTYQPAQA